MGTPLEVADIFRAAGPAYRAAQAGHLSLHQLKIMSGVPAPPVTNPQKALGRLCQSAVRPPRGRTRHLPRYTHRVAFSDSRLIRFDDDGVTFRYKDYRRKGAERQQVMTLCADEFIRRFLLHNLPERFHRIRH